MLPFSYLSTSSGQATFQSIFQEVCTLCLLLPWLLWLFLGTGSQRLPESKLFLGLACRAQASDGSAASPLVLLSMVSG